MTFKIWSEAVESLAAATGPSTSKQQELGKQVGTFIPPDVPKIIAAAMLRIALAKELELPPKLPVSDRYTSQLDHLNF